jgi:hypothetical protein
MPTQVAFSKTEQIQQQTDLGSFQTSRYQRIRVLADCRFDSGTSVEILLTLIESGSAPGQLDRFTLGPSDDVQRVYEVPGTRIAVSVTPQDPGETAYVDIWVWGYRLPGE